MGTGKSWLEVARRKGLNFRVVKNLSIQDGIQAARMILPRCWFDEDETERGVNCLTDYTKDWDEKNQTWRKQPKHDWTSHGADAFRYLAVAIRPTISSGRQTVRVTGLV